MRRTVAGPTVNFGPDEKRAGVTKLHAGHPARIRDDGAAVRLWPLRARQTVTFPPPNPPTRLSLCNVRMAPSPRGFFDPDSAEYCSFPRTAVLVMLQMHHIRVIGSSLLWAGWRGCAIFGPRFSGKVTPGRARGKSSAGMKHSRSEPAPDAGDNVRTQFGAVCWRMAHGQLDVLLITSRETGRWVIPKGWPVKGMSGPKSAEQEAWEEAGVEGKISKTCLGLFSYQKVLIKDEFLPCVVSIYGLRVEKLARRYPEQSQRQRKWFAAAKAARLVAEPELSALLLALDASKLADDDAETGKAQTGKAQTGKVQTGKALAGKAQTSKASDAAGK